MTNNHSPEYLIIGHVSRDNILNGAILGGTVSYSAMTACKLRKRTVAVTSYGPDIPSMASLEGIEIKNLSHSRSTTFENIYEDGVRHQKWLASSASLSLENVPHTWRNTPIVHLAPIAQEISPTMCGDFPNSLICVTMQGWLRGQNEQLDVVYQPHPELESWLPNIDILVVSSEDFFGDRTTLNYFLNSVKLGIETVGPEGCRVHYDNQVINIPVIPEVEVDRTGAGDIFATAFFIRYYETGDFIKAGQFANAWASLSVRKMGVGSIPNFLEAEKHLVELYGT